MAQLLALGAVALGESAHALARLGRVALTSASGLAVAYTDVRPVLPGHAIVAPTPSTEQSLPVRLSDMGDTEYDALFETVAEVCEAGSRGGATAHNIAIMDGAAAGQPVMLPSVHVHVVPRCAGDLENNDDIYGRIERWSPEGAETEPPPFEWPDDDARRPRTAAQMAAEAERYAAVCAGDDGDSGGASLLPRAPETFRFGKFDLDASQLFFASRLCVASVNLKPLCPGHVLVIPRRNVPLLRDLTAEERRELWRAVRRVQAAVMEEHGASGCKLGVQDGRDSGQSVPHVHVHVLPCK